MTEPRYLRILGVTTFLGIAALLIAPLIVFSLTEFDSDLIFGLAIVLALYTTLALPVLLPVLVGVILWSTKFGWWSAYTGTLIGAGYLGYLYQWSERGFPIADEAYLPWYLDFVVPALLALALGILTATALARTYRFSKSMAYINVGVLLTIVLLYLLPARLVGVRVVSQLQDASGQPVLVVGTNEARKREGSSHFYVDGPSLPDGLQAIDASRFNDSATPNEFAQFWYHDPSSGSYLPTRNYSVIAYIEPRTGWIAPFFQYEARKEVDLSQYSEFVLSLELADLSSPDRYQAAPTKVIAKGPISIVNTPEEEALYKQIQFTEYGR